MTSRLLAGFFLALVTLALSVVPALGHAELVSSDPPDGGTLATTPYTMTLEYDEPLDAEASSVVVRDAAGAEVASGGLSEDDDMVMTVELPMLPAGEYTVRWTAVTPDDNGVERGTLTFTVAEPVATATPALTPSEARATAAPTASAASTAAPTFAPTPSATPIPTEPTPTGGNDLLIALAVAGAALAAVVGFIVLRSRS